MRDTKRFNFTDSSEEFIYPITAYHNQKQHMYSFLAIQLQETRRV